MLLSFSTGSPERATVPGGHRWRAFEEITAANELDVVRHNPAIATEHGPALQHLLTRAGRHPSDSARHTCLGQEACRRQV